MMNRKYSFETPKKIRRQSKDIPMELQLVNRTDQSTDAKKAMAFNFNLYRIHIRYSK